METLNLEKKKNSLWRFLSSVRLTLCLLIFIAVISIIGTVVPQQEEAVRFAHNLSPALFNLFSSLQLFDMYHSIWFRGIIALLALNLMICSVDRFPASLKLFRARPRTDRLRPFDDLPPESSISLKGDPEFVKNQVAGFLKKRYGGVERKSSENGDFFSAEKWRFSYFGVYVVHLSVLIILMGAIVGSILGFEAYVNIVEGETVDEVIIRKSGVPKKLGFKVHCEKFTVAFYESGAPKEYRSNLQFLFGDKVVKEGGLLVNHPLTFNGINFYQSSYGTIPGKVHLKIVREGGNPEAITLEAKPRHPVPLPGNDGHFQVMQVDENLRGMMGPAALISIRPKNGTEIRFWVFQHLEMLQKRFPAAMFKSPMLNASSFKPYTFSLEKFESKYYTGLQVNRDPGVPMVWIGCFLMVGGLIVTFFTSHRRVMIWVSGSNEEIKISITGKANKNRFGMEMELDRLAERLRNVMAGEGRNNG